jgi:hypothetical protein
MVSSFARASNTATQAISAADVKLSYPDAQQFENISVATNSDFTIQSQGYYRLQTQGVFRLSVDNANTNSLNSVIKVNSTIVATSGESNVRRQDGVTTTAPEAPFSNFWEGFLAKGDIVTFHGIRSNSNGAPQVNTDSSISISRIINPNGESIKGTFAGYSKSQLPKNFRTCAIAQTSETSTPNFEDLDGCLDTGSRTATGVYSVTFNSGTYKTVTEFYCIGGGGRNNPASSQPPIVAAFDGDSGGVLIDAGNDIKVTSEFSSSALNLADAPWVIECRGEAP